MPPPPPPPTSKSPRILLPANVTLRDIAAATARYEHVVPSRLAQLDAYRYADLPQRVARRLGNKEETLMNKAELVELVEWKLRHGTFRPALLGQVKTNGDELVEQTVTAAVGELRTQLDDSASSPSETNKAILQAVNALAKPLRGIGPATASLVLAVCLPQRVPFFSDELWRWSVAAASDNGKVASSWTRAKIGYSVGEYARMLESVRAVQDRLEGAAAGSTEAMPDAVDLEKAAYVWARDVNGEASTSGTTQDKAHTKSAQPSVTAVQDRSSKKRKSESAQVNGRTRSSTRKKS